MACACDVSGGGELSGQGASSNPAALCVDWAPGSTQEHRILGLARGSHAQNWAWPRLFLSCVPNHCPSCHNAQGPPWPLFEEAVLRLRLPFKRGGSEVQAGSGLGGK